jgi:hypothetical protein
MAVLDLHLELFVITVRKIARDAADELIVIEGGKSFMGLSSMASVSDLFKIA